MNRKERRNLQRQGVQVPKDPTLNIKLSALGKSIMTPEMQMAAEHRRMRDFYEMDDLYPERLKLKELGADVEQWQKEVLANEPKTLGKR